MATEENKAIAKRVFGAWNTDDIDDVADQCVAPDAVMHDPQDPFLDILGPEHVKRLAHMYRAAFSDLHFDITLQIAEGDYVATVLEGRGTNDGEVMADPATVVITSTDKIVDGKIAETWITWDTLGMLQQRGLAPR